MQPTPPPQPWDAVAADWPQLNALLDEALALPAAEREAWLQRLEGTPAPLKATLSRLLAVQAGIETGEFLGTLPRMEALAGAHATAPVAEPGEVVGPWRLQRELGTGGMGSVWLAERADGSLKRPVALKLPLLGWARGLSERMARERDILATLEHPNIARLYDAGVDALGRPWLALEYVQGRPIDEHARNQGLDVKQRLQLLLQVCEAVAYAHSRLVIHRDLKPGNILVTEDGRVRLLDFGIARLMEADHAQETALTQQAGRVLTLDYASPEQIRGEPMGTASDVYALGVVAYELLSGSRPYRLKHGSTAELEAAIASVDPARASDAATTPAARSALRGDLDAILNKALKKSAAERYPTVAALALDIQSHLMSEPVSAQPDAFTYRAGKFLRRYRAQTAAALGLALVLVGASAVSLHQAEAARREAARAEAVKRFALTIFEEADTSGGGDRNTSALDLLRSARERIQRAQVADPTITIELLTSVAYSLVGLGEPKEALPTIQAAQRLAQEQLGPQHPLTHAAQLVLGETLLQIDETVPARAALEAAEAGMRATGNMAGLVHALRWKSQAQLAAGEFEPAIGVAREAVQLAESQLPADEKRTRMLAHTALASALGQINQPGRLASARRAYGLALEIHGQRLTAEVVGARARFASTLIEEGDPDAGLLELKSVIAQQAQLLGSDHVEVKQSLNHLGRAALSRGDAATAVESFRETLRIALLTTDALAEHALQRQNLGAALSAARRLQEAEAELRGAQDGFRALAQSNDLYARLGQIHLAHVLMRTDRLAEAEALVRPVLSKPDLIPLEAVTVRLRAGELYSLQGRHDEAVALLHESLDRVTKLSNPSVRARALGALGSAQRAAGQHAAAEASLQEALTLYRKLQIAGSPDQADLLVEIAYNGLALGRPGSAVDAASTAVGYWEKLDKGNPRLALARVALARAQAASGNAAGARSELELARQGLGLRSLRSHQALLAEAERSLRTGS